MQVVDHIVMCPAIAEAGGLEPYPQPLAAFAGAPTGTVQVRLFDTSVQPPVELTSGGAIALGSGLAASGLGSIPNSYVLDMGNAGVTGVVNAYTREGLECLVMFEDSGGSQAPVYVKVTCNNADHVAALYPEGAVYAVANSGVTGTAFPNGSIYRPCENLGDAVSVFSSRGAKILDCAGSWNGHPTAGSGGCLAADIGQTLAQASALIRTRTTAALYPHNSGDVINLTNCTVQSVNVPYGFALGNFTNGTYFAGTPTLVNCRIQEIYFTGDANLTDPSGNARQGGVNATTCKFDGPVNLSAYQSPGCWSFDAVGCINGSPVTIDFSSMGGNTATWVDCAGDYTLYNMPSGKAAEMSGIKGMPSITIDGDVGVVSSNLTVTLKGAYAGLTNNTGGALTSLTEVRQPSVSDLLTQALAQTAAEAAIAAQEPLTIDATGLATSAALATVDANVDTLLTRLGANDVAILKGLLTGNYLLDGGAGASSAVYDANGCMTAGRIRVFANAAATGAASAGAANGAEAEIYRVDITANAVTGQPYPANVTGVGQ